MASNAEVGVAVACRFVRTGRNAAGTPAASRTAAAVGSGVLPAALTTVFAGGALLGKGVRVAPLVALLLAVFVTSAVALRVAVSGAGVDADAITGSGLGMSSDSRGGASLTWIVGSLPDTGATTGATAAG